MRRSCPGSILSFALAALVVAVPGFAQSSRTEEIASQQAEKAQHLGPETSPRAEQIVVRVMTGPLLSGKGGLYPWFGSVFSGAGFAGGVGYLNRGPRGSRLLFTAGISINGSIAFDGR